jgi:hypothetical protein
MGIIILNMHILESQIILSTDFNNYVKGDRFRESMNSFLGTGVFNSDGTSSPLNSIVTSNHPSLSPCCDEIYKQATCGNFIDP